MHGQISGKTSINNHQVYYQVRQEKLLSCENHLARKQIFANSCGAASLLCAAKELGIDKMPVFKDSLSDITGIDSLELTNNCESDLYQITSRNYNPLMHHTNVSDSGYSMPEDIVIAARIIGLDTYAIENNTFFSKALSFIYPEVKEKLSSIGCELRQSDTPLNPNQRKLEAVAVSIAGVPAGLHWVLCRPDNSYMDPGTGGNSPDFSGMQAEMKKSNNKFYGYYKTGISVVLTKTEKADPHE